MSTTLKYKKKIADKLAYLESMLKRYGDMSLYEENLAMEDVVCNLLNLAYGYELVNLNGKEKNHPAIDLGDWKHGIAVQVTTTTKRDKVTKTLKSFDKAGLGDAYNRLIVFVLGSRKKFRKDFVSGSVDFLHERDIMDFSTLQKQINLCDLDTLKKVYDYLEQEYPVTDRELKWMKWQEWTKRIGIAMATLLLILTIWNIGTYIYEEFRKNHPKISSEWVDIHQAAYILGSKAKSSARIYTDEPVQDAYYFGNMVKMLYNNLGEHEEAITRLSVCVEDVVEDTSPRLKYSNKMVDSAVQHTLQNYGWGETGKIQISFIDIVPHGSWREQQDPTLPEPIALHEDAPVFWELESIKPGDEITFELLTEDDLILNPDNPQAARLGYTMKFELFAAETNYKVTLVCEIYYQEPWNCYASPVKLETTYVVWAETANSEWECTYPIQDTIARNSLEQIPIFIIPEKSCTMTVRIQLETYDGKIIDTIVLENAKFIIPYHSDKSEYIEEMILDWDYVCGKIIVFPNDADPYLLEREGYLIKVGDR